MSFETLCFSVSGGKIEASGSFLAADSVEYAIAEFTFDETWEGLLKTAVFRKGENVYHVVLEGDSCKIPFEVITDGIMYVSCFGVLDNVRATTVEAAIQIEKSGYKTCIPSAPTPDPYSYFLQKVTESEAALKQYAQTAQNAVDTAKESATKAAESADTAQAASQSSDIAYHQAYQSELATMEYAASAEESKNRAEEFKTDAELAAGQATSAAQAALGAVENHNEATENTHPDIREAVDRALAIAKGKATSLVFDTEANLKSWAKGEPQNFFPGFKAEEVLFEDAETGSMTYFSLVPLENGKATISDTEKTQESSSGYFSGGHSLGESSFTLSAGTYFVYCDSGTSLYVPEVGELIYSGQSFTITTEQTALPVLFTNIASGGTAELYLKVFTEEYTKGYVRADGKLPSDLKIGDNLYVIELGVPDYWWDGETIQPLGAEKPDLAEVVKKQDLESQLGSTVIREMSQSDYDTAYYEGTLEAGAIYFVYGEE